jgi:signal peptidase I
MYPAYLKNKVSSHLDNYEKVAAIKIDVFTEKFNNVFGTINDGEKYEFALHFYPTEISFSISKNGTPLDLDKQSNGFKWFFNFHTRLLASSKLKKGDIVLMDEPANSIHSQGIVLIRNILKS